jgi:hypothetical protein
VDLLETFASNVCARITAMAEVSVTLALVNAFASMLRSMLVLIVKSKSVHMIVSDMVNAQRPAVNAFVMQVSMVPIAILKTAWITATTTVNASPLLHPNQLANAIPSSAVPPAVLVNVLSTAPAMEHVTPTRGLASATKVTSVLAAIERSA